MRIDNHRRRGAERGRPVSRTVTAAVVLVSGVVLTGCATGVPDDGTAPRDSTPVGDEQALGAADADGKPLESDEQSPDSGTPAPPHLTPSSIQALLVPEAVILSGLPVIQENARTLLQDTRRIPPATTQSPPDCDLAVTLAGLATSGYGLQDTLGAGGRLQQEVNLFEDAAHAEAAYRTIQDRAATCLTVTTSYADAGDPRAVEVSNTADTSGAFTSFAQDVTRSADSSWTTEGYDGYVLVGNAIVRWSAEASNYHVEQMPRVDRAVLGPRDAVEAIVLGHLERATTP